LGSSNTAAAVSKAIPARRVREKFVVHHDTAHIAGHSSSTAITTARRIRPEGEVSGELHHSNWAEPQQGQKERELPDAACKVDSTSRKKRKRQRGAW
jgi:hypothetical protein